MKRNLEAPEQKPDCSNHINGAQIPSFFNQLVSNTNIFQNGFADVSAFNQHLISNLTTSLFMEPHNVWSKLITDLGLGSSLTDQNCPLSSLKPWDEKRKRNSFTISNLIKKSDDSPLNLSKHRNETNSQMSKVSVEPKKKEIKDKYENINIEFDLVENKLRLPLKFGFKRETLVREFTSNGVKGEIIYHSPCGRKLRNFQEIERYLYKFYADQKVKSSKIQLTKENFTFSLKYIVGNYLLISDANKCLDSSINHNNIKEINHAVLNEKEIITKIQELYPDFKRSSSENFNHNYCEKIEDEFYKNGLNDKKNFSHKFKQKEKYLVREKKARLRWFNYMISKYTDKKIHSEFSSCEAFSRTNHAQIDDMQQNFLSNLPEYDSLNTLMGQKNLSWLADAFQTFEFVANFGAILAKDGSVENQIDLSILISFPNFFLSLKNLKYKKEINELVQIMLKILLDDHAVHESNEEFDDDQTFLISNIRNFEMNESTFSEILRLYFVKSLKNLKSHRNNCSFAIDTTSNLEQKIQIFVQELEAEHFDSINIETKAAMLAHLTDDLLQNSSFLQNSALDQESRQPNVVSDHIEQTIEKLNKLKQEKIQINHKIRHSAESDEKMHKKKQLAQEEISSFQKQLRSGQLLGQDRFKRMYWKLNSFKPIFIESFFQGNIQNETDLTTDLNSVINDLIDQVETNLEKENVIRKFGHLIELNQESFSFKINSDCAEFLSLNFNDIEILVRNIFWNSKRETIPREYLSNVNESSDKWWIYEQDCSQILTSLSTHGFREKILAKNLHQIGDIGSDENFSDKKIDYNQAKQIRNERAKLMKQITSLENKVYNANLQLPQTDQGESNCDQEISDESQLIKCAKQRLLKLEKSIDKRYLKYPFSFKKKLSNYKLKVTNEIDQILLEKVEQNMNNSKINMSIKLNQDLRAYMRKTDANRKEDNDKSVTDELLRWRRLVNCSKTSSQIMIYLNQLNKYIEWDKSIMKASCHICSLDDNEESLLLCDNCDLGYHTYCFVPKIERIPDGDWYCFNCIRRFLGHKQMCYVCGRDGTILKNNDKQILSKCEKCSRLFHSKCLPNAKFFKTTLKWHCTNCVSNKSKNIRIDEFKAPDLEKMPRKRGRKRKCPLLNENIDIDDSKKVKKQKENETKEANNSLKKLNSFSERLTLKKIKQQNESDLYKCRILLNELVRHKYSNYFMFRVNEKEYPDYYTLIKEPIDLSTIKEKFKTKIYQNKEQFAYDCRLIFDNCECYNEDDSQIGQAGHKLRAFFETKWLKLFD